MRCTLAGLAFVLAATPLHAQCPDGSPPPCGSRRAAAPAALSVAVLTFDNLTRDTADAYLVDGLANDISNQLTKIARLAVTSRAAARRVSAADATPTALGRTLNAAYLVTGGIQRGGPRVRVSVELIRATTAQTVWSNQYDRNSSDLLSLQQEIATNVAAGIAGRLLPAERTTLAARPTTNGEAYDHILRGDFLVNQRSQAAFERALAEFETATRLDSGSARAFAGLGHTFGLCPDWGYRCRGLSDDSLRAAGRRSVARALAIDSLSPEAYAARSLLEYDRNPATGLRDIERAIALAPRSGSFHAARGWQLAEQLRLDEALVEYTRSLELDPARAVTWEHVARIATVQRRYGDAFAAYDSALRLEPALLPVYERRATLRAFLGDTAGARADIEAANARRGDPAAGAAWLAGLEAVAAAWSGDTARANHLLDSLRLDGPSSALSFLAWLKLGRGGEILAAAPPDAEQEPFWALMPWNDPIRSDPRFRAMLQRPRRNHGATP